MTGRTLHAPTISGGHMSVSRRTFRRAVLIAALGSGLLAATSVSAFASPAQPAPTVQADVASKTSKQDKLATRATAPAAAGLRAYLVITAPADVAKGKDAVTAKSGTVYASYDAIGVIVAHSS